jgi:hypothetical protein
LRILKNLNIKEKGNRQKAKGKRQKAKSKKARGKSKKKEVRRLVVLTKILNS